jgi:hypothetical protein
MIDATKRNSASLAALAFIVGRKPKAVAATDLGEAGH